jgi:hypothetical protein
MQHAPLRVLGGGCAQLSANTFEGDNFADTSRSRGTDMLRSVGLRVGARCTSRSAPAGRTAVANSGKASTRSALVNRRTFATQNSSDPKRHPRELDDDFEVVDPKLAPNLDKEEPESQLPLIFDVDPDTFNEVVSTAPMPLVALFHIPGCVLTNSRIISSFLS